MTRHRNPGTSSGNGFTRLSVAAGMLVWVCAGCATDGLLRASAEPGAAFLDVPIQPEPGQAFFIEETTRAAVTIESFGDRPIPGYRVRFNQLVFVIGVEGQNPKVTHVETRDAGFRTAEGLAVGDKLRAARVREAPGFPPHVVLESGWCAVITQPRADPYAPPPVPTVQYFFKSLAIF